MRRRFPLLTIALWLVVAAAVVAGRPAASDAHRVAGERSLLQPAAGVGVPDISVTPWLSAPANTWETTDIWVKGLFNGNTSIPPCTANSCPEYKYGAEQSALGDWVPAGNGDDPVILSGDQALNYVYVRVRNVGSATVPQGVMVHVDRTDPEGLGITGAWQTLGSTPLPNAIPPGGYEDVSVWYLPAHQLTLADWSVQNTSGGDHFSFHTCLRVRVDAAPGETVLTNQDGNGEQENISYFHADILVGMKDGFNFADSITLRNTSRTPRSYVLTYKSTLPDNWTVALDRSQLKPVLKSGELRRIPITVTSRPSNARIEPGTSYSVDVSAREQGKTTTPVGGVRFQIVVVDHVTIGCKARRSKDGQVSVEGTLKTANPEKAMRVLIGGVRSKPFAMLPRTVRVVPVRGGRFSGTLASKGTPQPDEAYCYFGGTKKLAAAVSPLARIP